MNPINSINQFDGIKGYATYKNAEKFIANSGMLNSERPLARFMIAVNSAGRFIPVAYNVQNGLYGMLAGAGFVVVN